jgi:hypothetical protein
MLFAASLPRVCPKDTKMHLFLCCKCRMDNAHVAEELNSPTMLESTLSQLLGWVKASGNLSPKSKYHLVFLYSSRHSIRAMQYSDHSLEGEVKLSNVCSNPRKKRKFGGGHRRKKKIHSKRGGRWRFLRGDISHPPLTNTASTPNPSPLLLPSFHPSFLPRLVTKKRFLTGLFIFVP